jgi:tRNA pseudouridine55 synthase
MNSVLIVDKPSGWTSHDVVARMRRILKQRSIGHLGTLDPLATGVLPLVTGSLTRIAQFYMHSEKSYEGTMRFGFSTNTYDSDGEPIDAHVGTDAFVRVGTAAPGCPVTIPALNLETLQSLATQFLGPIEQIPPPFSAKKIAGVPAYKLARKQKEVILQPVQVEIKEFAITALEGDRAHFRARVSSGTYMRSIAHEMGLRLGCGAHLATLRRTSVAEFTIAQAHTLEEIESQLRSRHPDQFPNPCHSEPVRRAGEESAVTCAGEVNGNVADEAQATTAAVSHLFVHPRQLLPQMPAVTADEPAAARIRHGHSVNLPELSRAPQIKVFANQNELLAIATRIAGTLFHPKIVFPGD